MTGLLSRQQIMPRTPQGGEVQRENRDGWVGKLERQPVATVKECERLISDFQFLQAAHQLTKECVVVDHKQQAIQPLKRAKISGPGKGQFEFKLDLEKTQVLRGQIT